MEWVLLIIRLAALAAAILAALTAAKMRSEQREALREMERRLGQSLADGSQDTAYRLASVLADAQKQTGEGIAARLDAVANAMAAGERRMEAMQLAVDRRLEAIQADTGKHLDEMRATVDEKLQTTLESRITQSFQLVNERLEQVYKGLGEMQTLATGVGDLKKVLSNVKTRGILGEVQLGAILEEILSPEQYDTNVVTRRGSGLPVEYAVKLPGADGGTVYLPIDAKFPGDTYAALQNAYESADAAAVETAAAQLVRAIRGFAKDIRDKYVDPPGTTEFGILFLPFEGLYAEAVRRGLVETLQREYRVTLAGPTTLAALLNALQMGFKTLAIQKRTSEVWSVLGAVKTEFDKFGDVLEATQNRLEQANRELDKLVGVRTRVIRSKLRDVTEMNPEDAKKLLNE